MTDAMKAGLDAQAIPANAPEQPLERRAWEALRGCAGLAEGVLRERLGAGTGLSVARLEALHALYDQPEGLTMGQLARALRVTNANATALVDALARGGWVAREAVPGDRRKTRAGLTEGGRKSFAALRPGFAAAVADLFAELSPSETRLLHGLLSKLNGRLRAEQARLAQAERPAQATPVPPKPLGWGWV